MEDRTGRIESAAVGQTHKDEPGKSRDKEKRKVRSVKGGPRVVAGEKRVFRSKHPLPALTGSCPHIFPHRGGETSRASKLATFFSVGLVTPCRHVRKYGHMYMPACRRVCCVRVATDIHVRACKAYLCVGATDVTRRREGLPAQQILGRSRHAVF